MNGMPRFGLMEQKTTTHFVPLVVLGWYVMTQDLLSPFWREVKLGKQGYHVREPRQALLDLWVSILGGCQSIRQINTKTRPDGLLARAWGRLGFHEQSTLARVLDGCTAADVQELRAGAEAVYRWIGAAPNRTQAGQPLMIDIDLTGLTISREAEGSTKGYFSQKRGHLAGSFAGSVPPITMRMSGPGCIQATPSARRCCRKRSLNWNGSYRSLRRFAKWSASEPMPGLAPTKI